MSLFNSVTIYYSISTLRELINEEINYFGIIIANLHFKTQKLIPFKFY